MKYSYGEFEQAVYWRNVGKMGFGLEKLLNSLSGSYWAILVRAWTLMLMVMSTVMAWSKMFQRGRILVSGLETILKLF